MSAFCKIHTMRRLFVLATVILGLSSGQAQLYVDSDASGAQTGADWENAFQSLQDALAAATPESGHTEIRVAQGVYTPDVGEGLTPGDRTATFLLRRNMAVLGGYAGYGAADPDERDWERFVTVLSGDLAGDDTGELDDPSRQENSYHVVTATNLACYDLLEGFTIQGGAAHGNSAITDSEKGAGLFLKDSWGVVRSCVITGNLASGEDFSLGGGAYVQGGGPEFVGCRFEGNAALSHIPDHGGGRGGGLYTRESFASAVLCTFKLNRADHGGGLYLSEETGCALLSDCRIAQNRAVRYGAGVYAHGGLSMVNCRMNHNQAEDDGGAIYGRDLRAELVQCVLHSNNSQTRGGVLFLEGEAELINCTLGHNWAISGGTVYCRFDSRLTMVNSVSWYDTSREGNALYAETSVDYLGGVHPCEVLLRHCVIRRFMSGALTIEEGSTLTMDAVRDEDPGFVYHPNGDYHLTRDSACIDAGDNEACPESRDFDGSPRYVDAPATADTGVGSPPIIDIGAYEYQGPQTIHVSAAMGDDENDGTAQRPVKTIDRGVELALDGDTVLVADGVYDDVQFQGKAIHVRSENGPDDCIIDFGGQHGIIFCGGEERDSILEGFTMTNASTGAVMCTDDSSPTIRRNVLRQNSSYLDRAGGITCWGGASPLIIENIFEDNVSQYSNPESTPAVGGAAIWCWFTDDVEIVGNVLRRNTAEFGAAISVQASDRVRIENNRIYDNVVEIGGAVVCGSGLTTLRNNTIADNRVLSAGGGVQVIGQAVLDGNILWGNVVAGQTGEAAQLRLESGMSVSLHHNCIQGWSGGLVGVGNFGADPLFVDSTSGDYHLRSQGGRWSPAASDWVLDSVTSPCIDAGNPGAPLAEEPLVHPSDRQGEHSGNIRINLGAYAGTAEASLAPPSWMLLGDIDNDLQVDLADFALLAGLWMQQQPADPNDGEWADVGDSGRPAESWPPQAFWADLNRDGRVDMVDLDIFVEENWLDTAYREPF